MRRKIFVALLFASLSAAAQESYLNDYMVNTSDLFGTARYVGMGGALGALGADISAISSNPAAIGMYRRTATSITFGAISQSDKNTDGEKTVYASLDQLGLVASIPFNTDGLQYLNFGFNYQKKNHFGHTFLADNANPGKSSLMNNLLDTYDVISNMQGGNGDPITPVVDLAGYAGLLREGAAGVYAFDDPDATKFCIDGNRFKRIMKGHTHSFDFNLSANVCDRYFLGVTVGVDRLKYESHGIYDEAVSEVANSTHYHDFSFNNWQQVEGYGYNIKLGAIIRPIEELPLRFGLAIETPTWYSLDYTGEASFTTRYQLTSDGIKNPFTQKWAPTDFSNKSNYTENSDVNALTYNLSTPWRFRLSAGHTIGTWLAIGAEYEYASYGSTSMSYPSEGDGWYDSDGIDDEAMNRQTHDTHQGVHAVKLGIELKPFKQLALRAGYNYYSASSRREGNPDNAIDSYSTLFQTSTDYMKLGDVNIATFGIGYAGNHLYFDIACKYRVQSADFYPYHDPVVQQAPINVNLDRYQLFATLGYKF